MSAAAPSRGTRPLRGRRRGAPLRGKHSGETIRLSDIAIAVTRKDIKHVHLSVHPPGGRVTLVAPTGTRPEVARAYAVSRLGWIREQQSKLRGQARLVVASQLSLPKSGLWPSVRRTLRKRSRR